MEDLVKRAEEIAEWSREVATWEEWEQEEQVKRRSKKEELWLRKQLDELDSSLSSI